MDNRPLAIIDSGLGGLTIAQAIWQRLPKESTIYLADHQYFPYGDKSTQEINRRLVKIIDFLLSQDCKIIVVACNTITAASISFLRSIYKIPFIGTEPAIRPAIENFLKENIVVLATQATAKSKSFKGLIKKYDEKGKVMIHSCPGLADAIEEFAANKKKLKQIIKQKYLDKIKTNYSAIVLGSTHYILVKKEIKSLVHSSIKIIEPSQAIAQQTGRILLKNNLQTSQLKAKKVFLTTGDAKKANLTTKSLLKKNIIFKTCSL